MLGIPTAHVLADLQVGVLPEACQVGRDGQRALGWGQQVDHHRHLASGNRRSFGPAEQGLELGRQYRAVFCGVIQRHGLAGGDRHTGGGQVFQSLLLWIIQQAGKSLVQVEFVQITPADHPCQERAKPGFQVVCQPALTDRWPFSGKAFCQQGDPGKPLFRRRRPWQAPKALLAHGGEQPLLHQFRGRGWQGCFLQLQLPQFSDATGHHGSASLVPDRLLVFFNVTGQVLFQHRWGNRCSKINRGFPGLAVQFSGNQPLIASQPVVAMKGCAAAVTELISRFLAPPFTGNPVRVGLCEHASYLILGGHCLWSFKPGRQAGHRLGDRCHPGGIHTLSGAGAPQHPDPLLHVRPD